MQDVGKFSSPADTSVIDPAGLTGIWLNSESVPRGVARVVIELHSGRLRIWALAADDQSSDGWGWADSDALYAASPSGGAAAAFTATYQLDSMPVVLHANVSKGLLIVSSFQTRYSAGKADRRFAREFFHKASSSTNRPSPPTGDRCAARTAPATASASAFVGTWRNTNSESSGIASVSFATTPAGATMRILGMEAGGLRDWGTTPVDIYVESGVSNEPARLKASYDLGFQNVLLHGWVKQGILVFALFRRFTDSSVRSNYFDREFFYRADESPRQIGEAHGLCRPSTPY